LDFHQEAERLEEAQQTPRMRMRWYNPFWDYSQSNYARHIVWYAFGAAEDIGIAALKLTQEQTQNFYAEAKKIEAEQIKKSLLKKQPQYRMQWYKKIIAL
jgi:hypothetical protein